MRQRSERLGVLLHGMTAFVLFLKGVSKLDHPEGHWPVIVVGMGGGLLIALGTFFQARLAKDHRYLEALVSFIEALMLGLVGLVSVEEGKRYIQYPWFAASAAFFVATAFRLWGNPFRKGS